MIKTWVTRNKYIRLRIVTVHRCYRADISINKYAYDKREERYYEINFNVFSPYDYTSDEETFEKAREWLYEELKLLQDAVGVSE